MDKKKFLLTVISAVILAVTPLAITNTTSIQSNHVEAATFLKRQSIPAKYRGTWYSGHQKVKITKNTVRGRGLGHFHTVAYHSNVSTMSRMHYSTHKLLWWYSGRGIEFSLPSSQPATMTVTHKNGYRVLNLYIGIGAPAHYYRR